MIRLPTLASLSTKVKAILLVSVLLAAAIPTLVVSDTIKITLPGTPDLKQQDQCTRVETFNPSKAFDGKNVSVPRFCTGEVDNILGALIEDGRNLLRNLNATLNAQARDVEQQYALRHLHAPGNVLRDDFDGRREGGFGDWQRITPSEEDPWATTTTKGNTSLGVGKGRTGYPTGLDTYLVSPEVDLTGVIGPAEILSRPRALLEAELALIPDTLSLEEGRTGSTVNATDQGAAVKDELKNQVEALRDVGVDVNVVLKAYSDTVKALKTEARARVTRAEHLQLILLEMKVRHNLANNTDGWRLEAFFEPPTAENIDTLDRLVLTPNSDPTDVPRSNLSMRPEVKVFGRGPAFTGATRNWENATFDLSSLIGERVWLALHLKTDFLLRANEQYFRERERFERTDYYGLHLDSLRLNATSYPMNAQAKAIEKPDVIVDGDVVIPATGKVPVVVVVRNAGLHTETLHVTLTVTEEATAKTLTTLAKTVAGVPPGGVRNVPFEWTGPRSEGTRYLFEATAALSGEPDPANPLVVHAETDATTAKDNTVTLLVRALTLARLGALPDPEAASRIVVSPRYAEENAPRTVTLLVQNTGTTTSKALITPSLSKGGAFHLNFIEGYRDGKAPTREKTLAPGETATVQWTLRPAERGTYDLEFVFQELKTNGQVGATLGTAAGKMYVRDSPPVLCLDDLGDQRECGLGLETGTAPLDAVATYLAADGTGFVATSDGGLYRYAPDALSPTSGHVEPGARWRALDGTSATDVWAAGDDGRLMRYDGTRWTNVTGPTVTGDLTDLAVTANGIYALADGTAYRRARDGGPWTLIFQGEAVPPLVHLDAAPRRSGPDWIAVANATGSLAIGPAPGASGFALKRVTNAVTALEFTGDGGLHVLHGGLLETLHFNGTAFRTSAVQPTPAPVIALSAVSNRTLLAIGSNGQVWKVGGAPLVIGAATPAGEGAFEGLIDSVRVSRVALDGATAKPTLYDGNVRPPSTTLEPVVTANTVALYRFNGSANTTVDDTDRHPLTLRGGARYDGRDASPAASSPGTLHVPEGGAAYTEDSLRFDLGSEGTLEAWVRPENPFRGGVLLNREIPVGDLSGVAYRLQVNTEGMPELLLGDGANLTRVTSALPLRPDTWAHVAAAWDGYVARLYVDGKLAGATAQAPYAYRDPVSNLTPLASITIPWTLLPVPSALHLEHATLHANGALFAVGGGGLLRGPPTEEQARGDWIRDAGLTGRGNPDVWLGRGAIEGETAILYGDSRDAVRLAKNVADGDLATLNTASKTHPQNRYVNVVLRIRHAPVGEASLYLTRLPPVQVPSTLRGATPTVEDATADLLDVPSGTTGAVERFLVATWNGTSPEWRTDTFRLDRILQENALEDEWFLTAGLLLEAGPGATWAVDEIEVRGNLESFDETFPRETLLYTGGGAGTPMGVRDVATFVTHAQDVAAHGQEFVRKMQVLAEEFDSENTTEDFQNASDDLQPAAENLVKKVQDLLTEVDANELQKKPDATLEGLTSGLNNITTAANNLARQAQEVVGVAQDLSREAQLIAAKAQALALALTGNLTPTVGGPAATPGGNVGHWDVAPGGQAAGSGAVALKPLWSVTRSPLRAATGSLWRVADHLHGEDGAWVYNGAVSKRFRENEDARLVTPPISLAGATDPTLTFLHKHRLPTDSTRTLDHDGDPGTPPERVTDLLALTTVELQIQQADGTWGPYLPLVPDGGYPAAPASMKTDPLRAFQPGKGYWGATDPAWLALAEGKLNDTILQESAWKPASFNLTAQSLPESPLDRVVRFAFRFQAAGATETHHRGGEGWYLADLRVKGSERSAIDLAVANATVATPYNATLLGVGPATTVPVHVNVTNPGLFPVIAYNVTVEARQVIDRENRLFGPALPVDTSGTLRAPVAPGATERVTVPWNVPAANGAEYVLTVRVNVLDDTDGDLTNNVLEMGTAKAPLRAKASPDVAVGIAVTPKAATREIDRRIDIVVENVGNVPIREITLVRDIERATASGRADPLNTTRWLIATADEDGLLPGEAEDLRRFLILARPLDPANTAENLLDGETRFSPPENARFIFTATALLEGDRNASNNVAKDLIDSFTVFHEDTLDTRLTPQEGGYVVGPGWNLVDSQGADGGKEFRFGDAATGRVPGEADSSLLLPVVDVSSAASATLTFTTNVSFESRYDGGIVETRSYRNGAWSDWSRLTPEPFDGDALVVDELHDGNPLARAAADPRGVTALTNASHTAAFAEETGSSDGWFTVSYNLGKASGMSEAATFVSHTLDSLLNDAAAVLGDPMKVLRPDFTNASRAVFRGKSWGEGLEGWEVHNLTHNAPWPKLGPSFLWSGSPDATDDGLAPQRTVVVPNDAVHRASYPLDLTGLAANRDVALTFWLWVPVTDSIACDAADTRPFCLRIFNQTDYQASANAYAVFDPATATVLEQDGQWTKYEILFSKLRTNAGLLDFRGKEMTIRLEFIAHRPYRGIVVDDLQATAFTLRGTERVDLTPLLGERGGGLPTPTLSLGQRGLPRAAGTPLTSEAGLTWAEVRTLPSIASLWYVATRPGGVPGEEDRYFTTSNPATGATYAVNMDTRLVTPLVDLTRLLGDRATLRFDEKHEFAPLTGIDNVNYAAHYGVVEASVLNEASGEWGPWRERCPTGPAKAGEACRFLDGTYSDAEWASHAYDVSDLKGKKVRFAFHAVGGPVNAKRGFAVDNVELDGDVLTGAPLQIRLRAGTDGSGHRGAWTVDNLQVVGTVYKNNVEVSLDAPPILPVVPGGSVLINGTLRNLGENTRDNLMIRVDAAPASGGEDEPLPTLALVTTTPATGLRPAPAGSLLVGPFNLLRNGNATFSLRVTAPVKPGADGTTSTAYLVTVGARRLVEPSLYPRLVEDEVTTNLDRTVTVEARSYREVRIAEATTTPSNATPGGVIEITERLTNTGTLPANVTVTCSASRLAGHSPGDYTSQNDPLPSTAIREVPRPCTREGPGGNLTLAPGGESVVRWTFKAPQEEGLYAILLGGSYPATAFSTAPLTAVERLVAVGDGFEILGGTFDTPEQNAPWRLAGEWLATDETTHRGTGALLAGAPARAYESGQDYGRGSLSLLTSPLVDLRNYTDVPAALSFWYLPRFAEGDGAVLEARILNNEAFPDQEGAYTPWCRLTPEGGYPGKIKSFVGSNRPGETDPRPQDENPLYPITPNGGIGDPAIGTPGFTGFKEEWTRAIFPLDHQTDPRAGDLRFRRSFSERMACEEARAYLGHVVQFRLVMGTGMPDDPTAINPDPIPRGRGQGWYVDDVLLSPYRGKTSPLSQEWIVPDDSRKVYRVAVRNDGPFTETFTVDVNPRGTAVPASWTLRVLTPVLTLPAGGEAEAAIEVTAPREPTRTKPATFPVALTLQGLEDPNRLEEVTLTLDFLPRPWPDLTVRIQNAPATAQERVPVDMLVEIRNGGRAPSAPTTLRLLDETTGAILATAPVGALSADRGAREDLRLSWTPARGEIGPHVLRVELDPFGDLEEYRRDNNVVTHTIDVGRLQRPDLLVKAEDMSVEGPGGNALDLREGDVVRIKVTVTNIGVIGAKEATARMSIGPLLLPAKSLGFIPPGGNATAVFTWLARAGEWTVQASADVEDVELNENNNRVETPITVKSFGVAVSVEPDVLTLAPGERALLTYTLVNEGNADERVLLDASVPEGVRVDGLGGEMLLSVGQTTRRTVTLEVTAAALAGETQAGLVARATGGSADRSLAPLLLTVLPVHKVAAMAGSVTGTPGNLLLPVTLVNEGNSADPITLEVELPDGWTLDEDALTATIAPGERAILQIPLTAPGDTAPGAYPVSVTATLGAATATTKATVLVEEVTGIRVKAQAPGYDEAAGRYVVPATLENVGNAPTEARLLAVELPDGWTLDAVRDRATLLPGETTRLQVMVKPPAAATAGVYGITLYADVPGIQPLSPEGQAARSRVEVALLRPDLTLADLETSPRFNLVEGDDVRVAVLVKNLGIPTARTIPVHLFVDDKFVAATDVLLAAGENRTIEIPWRAVPGSHTLTVAVDPERDFAETDEENNAVSTLLSVEGLGSSAGVAGAANVPSVPIGFVLLVLLGVGALVRRRSR